MNKLVDDSKENYIVRITYFMAILMWKFTRGWNPTISHFLLKLLGIGIKGEKGILNNKIALMLLLSI